MRLLAPGVWASPQVPPQALTAAAAHGVKRVINNRPDFEDPGQPTSTQMEEAARALGLDYRWIPIAGAPARGDIEAVGAALGDGVPTLLFCRSGMRSAAVWAMAARLAGADPATLRRAALAAGYDLSRVPL